MDKSLESRLAEGATLVVDNRLAAVQFEVYLARATAHHGPIWRSAPITDFDAWIRRLWLRQSDLSRLPLQPAQAAALWERVIASSPAGDTLLNPRQVARWAADAWQRLHVWCLNLDQLDTARDSNFESFIAWARQYSARLKQNNWLDPAELPGALAAARWGYSKPTPVVWGDPWVSPPQIESCSVLLQRWGVAVSEWRPRLETPGAVHKAEFADASAELDAAIEWSLHKLDHDPDSRVALIVPPTDERLWAIRRLAAQMPAFSLLDGTPVIDEPVIGAALTCLELYRADADFHTLSRWLRCPFLAPSVEGRAARCAVEAELRSELLSQLRLRAAFRSAGLERWMARRVPVLTQLLGGALAWFAELPNRQSATAWSRDCQTLLGRLGWLGNSGEPPARALDAWNRAWTDFATLSPVIGNVTFDEALTAVRSILTRSRQVAPIPLRGITVLSAAEDLGPGYDAAWMLGVTDTAWPRPATPNPLLPHALQAAHEMPYATPALSLQRCRALIQRLRSRVPELVMSYPLRDDDLAAAPSPFLGDFAWAEALPPNLSADAGVSGLPELHVIDDPAPRFDERVLSGGAATLRLQARCPLRAFIERRLDARPLEVLHRGLSGRHRGIATHRAVELLYARYRTREELGGLDRRTLETAVRVCADQALNDLTRGVRWALSAFVELEHERLERALLRLVEADLRRAEYTVEQLESKIIAEINGLQVSSRIDRIDRLAAGDSAIIDYKTGSRATPADWFKDRLIEPQLPLYAYSVSAPVGALAFAAIRATDVTYRGVWLRDGEFKGSRSGAVTQADWERQQLRWTEQLETLVDEFRRGDTRILVALRQDVEGSLAPLSRVFEQLAAAEDI